MDGAAAEAPKRRSWWETLTPEQQEAHRAKMTAGRAAKAKEKEAAALARAEKARVEAKLKEDAEAVSETLAAVESVAGEGGMIPPAPLPAPYEGPSPLRRPTYDEKVGSADGLYPNILTPTPQPEVCRCGHPRGQHAIRASGAPELACAKCACGHYDRFVQMTPPEPKPTMAQEIAQRTDLTREEREHLRTLALLEDVLKHTSIKAPIGHVRGRCLGCVETHRSYGDRACILAWERLDLERRRLNG